MKKQDLIIIREEMIMLTKESKMRILENFYAIDFTLFGKRAPQVETCCPETIQEYVTVKGALL